MRMKVAPTILFLYRDSDGFGAAVADALHPEPNSSIRRLEESFELSLENYNIKDCKACGDLVHFADDNDNFMTLIDTVNSLNREPFFSSGFKYTKFTSGVMGCLQISRFSAACILVTLLLLNNYEPPILACAINEVLSQIIKETVSGTPKIVAPFLVASSKLRCERKPLISNNKVSLYALHTGQETEIHSAITASTKKPPPSLQIHDEPLACFLQLARNLKSPTTILIGQRYQSLSHKEELQVLYEIGEVLASSMSLCFLRDKVMWNPTKNSKDIKEPWRALYG